VPEPEGKVRGEPWHTGTRPPLYPSVPGKRLAYQRAEPQRGFVPDTVLDGAAVGPFEVRAASIRGDAHRYHGEPRQDSLCVGVLGTPGRDLLVLAVADGVGSQPRSQIGSTRVCQLLLPHLEACAAELDESLGRRDEMGFAVHVNAALANARQQFLADISYPAVQYSTTVRALVVPLNPLIRARGFFAIGDGGLARLRAGSWDLELEATTMVDDARGVIRTATDAFPNGYDHVEASLLLDVEPGDVLVLCTDGLSTPLKQEAELRDFLSVRWSGGEVPGTSDFLWEAQARSRTYDDDRTVICLWEHPE
jgi:serine/threonine protein phosphatase PrpC